MTDIELLPLPEWTKRDDAGQNMVPSEIRVSMADYAHAVAQHNVKERDAEIEALQAALESLKAHKENAAMNQIGVIKALTEARDELGAEIHRLRAELKIEKGQAEFYRTTRNWSQQKAERLAEALRAVVADMREWGEPAKGTHVERIQRRLDDALRDHDQEGK